MTISSVSRTLATTENGAAINGRYFHRLELEPPRNKQAVDPELAR
ncbi:hypothetical protein OH799_23915 [Nocardia sp. NBC_00881]|nr:hypothetical protein OH799_23915 [Nocardia sp. NBC_00881]